MENMRIRFTVPAGGGEAFSEKAGRRSFCCRCDGGCVTAQVYYDFREVPLKLEAAVKAGDEAELRLMPHRIELAVNGDVQDEEWPAGQRLLQLGDPVCGSLPVTCGAHLPQKRELPAVLAEFEGAEGWRPGGGVFVGDCMPYVDGGRYHVLYLKDRRHHQSKWGLGAHQWEHISTADFRTWQVHPMAVAITHPGEGSICTGSWIKNGDTHYLFYTVRMADGSPARICRSLSADGYHFEKDESFAFILSEKYHRPSARDPKLFRDDDGLFHMILTTSLLAENRGCLAHLVSRDLDAWRELEAPMYLSADEEQPECPDYIRCNGWYYLIFSLKGSAHYLYSRQPFGNWQQPGDSLIPCEGVPKGGVWKDGIVFTGFKRMEGYAGTLAFRTAHAAETGELIFQ